MKPLEYSVRDQSTFFDASGPVHVDYSVRKRSRLGIPLAPLASVDVRFQEIPALCTTQFYLPRNLKCGKEYNGVEDTLYNLISNAVRTHEHYQEQQCVQREVLKQEDEIIGAQQTTSLVVRQDVTDKLLNSVKYVTRITTLNKEGLQQKPELDAILADYKTDHDTQRVQRRLQQYFGAAYPGNDVVPTIREVPDPIMHAVYSGFVGGLMGNMAIDHVLEPVLRSFGVDVNMPGTAIGITLEFLRPYVLHAWDRITYDDSHIRLLTKE